jgi:hypothetical protein
VTSVLAFVSPLERIAATARDDAAPFDALEALTR